MSTRRRWTIVVVQLPIAEHAALIVVVAGPASLAELVVATESTGCWVGILAVVVGVLIGTPTAAGHRGRMSRAGTRCASASGCAGVTGRP